MKEVLTGTATFPHCHGLFVGYEIKVNRRLFEVIQVIDEKTVELRPVSLWSLVVRKIHYWFQGFGSYMLGFVIGMFYATWLLTK